MRKLIRKTTTIELTGLSYGTIRRLYLAGEFPKPVQLTSGGSVAWFENEVSDWIESRPIVTPATQRQVAAGSQKRGRPCVTKTPIRKAK